MWEPACIHAVCMLEREQACTLVVCMLGREQACILAVCMLVRELAAGASVIYISLIRNFILQDGSLMILDVCMEQDAHQQ